MTRVQRAAWWMIPSLFCLWLYWYGLNTWFLADDFAWLGLHLSIFNFHDLLDALFAPKAQGTIRPLSERAYFLIFERLFQFDALPFHIWTFLTAFADLALLAAITLRLTGSRMAGLLAPVFWIVNSSLAVAMSWCSTYNQILCTFFLLMSFWSFLRYIDTGRRRFYALQWVSFLLGFGALELNVVYPAIALLYALCCARKYAVGTIPMFVASAAYTLVHNHFAPTVKTGVYGMHWDSRIIDTFWTYFVWALGPQRLELITWNHRNLETIGTAMLLIGLLGFSVWKVRQRNWLPVFLLGWFVLVIAPILPLREHQSHYYVAIPVVGLAVLGAWACAEGASGSLWARTTAAVLAAVYMASSIPVTRDIARWHHDRSAALRDFFFGVERAHELHPHDILLLKGVSEDLFWGGVWNSPFRLLGVTEIYLTPGTAQNLPPHPEIGRVEDFELPSAATLRALDGNRTVVYEVGTGPLRNITSIYRRLAAASLTDELPRSIDVGQDLFRNQLGPTWYPPESGYRWMPQSATVRLGGPRSAAEELHLSGYIPEGLVRDAPLHLIVSIGGQPLRTFTLGRGDTSFSISTPLPESALNKGEVEITLQTDRTFTPPKDSRPLSLAFGKIAVH